MRVADVGDPIAHGLVDGVLERFTAGPDANYFGAEHAHARNIESLAGHVFRAHVHGALHTEVCCNGGGSAARRAACGILAIAPHCGR